MHEPSEMADGQEAREDAMVGLACCCSRVERVIILCYHTTAKWPWTMEVEAGRCAASPGGWSCCTRRES